MATNDNVRDVAHVLAVLSNEDEFICKPLQSGNIILLLEICYIVLMYI